MKDPSTIGLLLRDGGLCDANLNSVNKYRSSVSPSRQRHQPSVDERSSMKRPASSLSSAQSTKRSYAPSLVRREEQRLEAMRYEMEHSNWAEQQRQRQQRQAKFVQRTQEAITQSRKMVKEQSQLRAQVSQQTSLYWHEEQLVHAVRQEELEQRQQPHRPHSSLSKVTTKKKNMPLASTVSERNLPLGTR